MSESSPTVKKPNRRRWWLLGGIGAALAGVLSLAASSSHGHWHHRGGGQRMAQLSPEDAARRIDKMVDWVLSYVDASTEQKQRVAELARTASVDLLKLHQEHRANRDALLNLLAGATVERDALETLRARELQLADTASRRFADVLAGAAEVLTAEQRAQLVQRARRHWG